MLKVDTEYEEKVAVLTIAGPVDSATFEQFKTALHAACQKRGSRVLLDCKDLTYMNSKSFGLLAQHHRICLVGMGRMALCNLNRKMVKTMDLLGLGQMLKIYGTREEALAELK